MGREEEDKAAKQGLLSGLQSRDSDEFELEEPARPSHSSSIDERESLLHELEDEEDVLRASRSSRVHARAYDESQRTSLPLLRLPSLRSCLCATLAVLVVLILLLGGGAYHVVKNVIPPTGQSPPFYPAPRGGTDPAWADAYKKAAKMVGKMSLLEKVNVTTGTNWGADLCVGMTAPALSAGFPALCLQDGPLGLRFADHATAWPAGIHVGATWNKELMHTRGQLMGREAKAKGINVLLGPSVGPLGRMPGGGRNWEGFGADPALQGIAAAETIKGVQGEGVVATIKHFVANEQEHFRQSWEWVLPNAITVQLDDRPLMEMYAWPFMNAIHAGVGSLMCSYNQVNNSYACGNSWLMNGVAKHEFGFQGFIQSDWLAKRSGVDSALAGLDMDMPGDGLIWANGKTLWGQHLTMAVLNGSLPIERLDDATLRIVAAWYQFGQDKWEKVGPNGGDGPNFSSFTKDRVGKIHPESDDETTAVVNQFVDVQGFGQEFHGRTAKEVAAEGHVLLKNERAILPFNSTQMGIDANAKGQKHKIGIFGEDAGAPSGGPNMCPDRSCNDGTLAMGWGSGAVEFPYLNTPLQALESSFDFEAVDLVVDNSNSPSIAKVNGKPSPADQDMCLVFANADAGEGFHAWADVKGDRPNLKLQKRGDALITTVADLCGGPTIVVIHTVGPVLMEEWIDHPNVKAVINAGLPGQESGNALTDVMFGHVDATGRLPYTIAKSEEDYGEAGKILFTPNGPIASQDFKEGLLIDYRHFDHYSISPRFEFGFGLSFTQFEFSDLTLTELKTKSAFADALPSDKATAPPDIEPNIPLPEDVLFPEGFRRLSKRMYPYLDEADLDHARPNGTVYPYPDGYVHAQPSPRSRGSGGFQGGNPALWEAHVSLSLTVTNTGARPGKQVVQAYVGFPGDAVVDPEAGERLDTPVRVLRQFEKTRELGPGEAQTVELRLNRRDLSYWSSRRAEWVMPPGEIRIDIGASSRDIWESRFW